MRKKYAMNGTALTFSVFCFDCLSIPVPGCGDCKQGEMGMASESNYRILKKVKQVPFILPFTEQMRQKKLYFRLMTKYNEYSKWYQLQIHFSVK